jgi:hypothetical protein
VMILPTEPDPAWDGAAPADVRVEVKGGFVPARAAMLLVAPDSLDARNTLDKPDAIAAVLDMRMADWKPKLNGRDVLDPETRKAAARFLAGIAFNASKALSFTLAVVEAEYCG